MHKKRRKKFYPDAARFERTLMELTQAEKDGSINDPKVQARIF